MGIYKNILAAVDLHPAYDEFTTQRAVEFARECNGILHILHVVESIHAYGAAQGYEIIMQVENQIAKDAENALNTLSKKYGIPPAQQIIAKGLPRFVILEQAKKLNADLIIVGGHGRHGISLLLGSTADGVTHHAECDVLAVRNINKKKN